MQTKNISLESSEFALSNGMDYEYARYDSHFVLQEKQIVILLRWSHDDVMTSSAIQLSHGVSYI